MDEDLVLDQLKRKAYLIKVKDDNLIDNDELFLASVRDNDGRYYYKAMKLSEMDNYYKKLGVFYLKADQIHMDGANWLILAMYWWISINLRNLLTKPIRPSGLAILHWKKRTVG